MTRKIVLLAFMMLTAVSCYSCRWASHPDPRLPARDVTVTLMTYNVGVFHKDYEKLGHYSYPEVAALIKSTGAQVIGLNETDWERPRTDSQQQVKELAALLGKDWDYQFTYALDPTYGNSLLWKKDLDVVQRFPRLELAKETGAETRSMGAVEFDEFIFCVTHLDHKSEPDQLSAVAKITEWAALHTRKPIFLVGDMNAVPSSKTIQELQKRWTLLSTSAYTFSADNLRKCIDYIFVYKDCAELRAVEVLDGGVITPADNPSVADASDHCPVWARVKLTIQPLYR